MLRRPGDRRKSGIDLLHRPSDTNKSAMPDRADYLAQRILTRLQSLERDHADLDAAPREETNPREPGRRQAIEKILAVDVGTTDHATVDRVLSALPRLSRSFDYSGRDRAEFAAFLRQHLPPTW